MNKTIYIILFLFFSLQILAQQTNLVPKPDKSVKTQYETQIFDELESYIKDGNVTGISKYFGQQTYFSLSNGISGYYSSNQAFYVLEDFFKLYKVTSFKFEHVKTDNNNSYGTGKYSYDNKGKRNVAQVYLSLKKVGNHWNITQLTIN
jgi:hypothetical protein